MSIQPVQPVVMMHVQQTQLAKLSNINHKPTAPLNPSAHGIIYETHLNADGRCIGCTCGNFVPTWAISLIACPCCWPCVLPCCTWNLIKGQACGNYLCYQDKIQPRGYVRIYENRIEANYPKTNFWGACLYDDIAVRHFDLPMRPNAKIASSCTPFHFCCFCGCADSVVTIAPSSGTNTCWCNCLREFYPAIPDPQGFVSAYTQAMAAWEQQNARLPAGAFVQTAPTLVQMV